MHQFVHICRMQDQFRTYQSLLRQSVVATELSSYTYLRCLLMLAFGMCGWSYERWLCKMPKKRNLSCKCFSEQSVTYQSLSCAGNKHFTYIGDGHTFNSSATDRVRSPTNSEQIIQNYFKVKFLVQVCADSSYKLMLLWHVVQLHFMFSLFHLFDCIQSDSLALDQKSHLNWRVSVRYKLGYSCLHSFIILSLFAFLNPFQI